MRRSLRLELRAVTRQRRRPPPLLAFFWRSHKETNNDVPQIIGAERALRSEYRLIRDSRQLQRLLRIPSRNDTARWRALILVQSPCHVPTRCRLRHAVRTRVSQGRGRSSLAFTIEVMLQRSNMLIHVS